MSKPSEARRPVGIYVLALLMFLVGGIWLLAAVALPLLSISLVPWYVYLAAAVYFLVLGWGMWGLRRWSYLAALLMCAVLAFYLIRTAVVFQQNMLLPFLLVAAIFGYLIQPRVRAAFLAPPGAPPEPGAAPAPPAEEE